MRKFLCAVLVAVGLVQRLLSYSPIIDGALAEVLLSVVDETGKPVPNATVSVAFYVKPGKSQNQTGQTDAEGCFSAKGRCIGEAKAWVRKEGYYDTRLTPRFRTLSVGEARKIRCWSRGAEKTTVILKQIHQPVKTMLHHVDYMGIPATNQTVALDLESFQWCPPYGKGKHEDVHLFYDVWRSPTNWFNFSCKLMVSFPHCADGFYRMKTDPFSGFRYVYQADANAVFEKSFELDFYREYGRKPKDVRLPDDEYLIFRTRTVTNEVGRVVRANYGRIGEKMCQILGLSMRVWFNPTPNDTNLEDARLVP